MAGVADSSFELSIVSGGTCCLSVFGDGTFDMAISGCGRVGDGVFCSIVDASRIIGRILYYD